jgi:hypothetical protein
VIDMDAVADAVGKEAEKPPFYYVEVSQQNKFVCNQCGSFNDILGRFGYCSRCVTRNNFQELETITVQKLRDQINSGRPYEDCARDAVPAFNSFAGQYARQLVQRVPLTPARKSLFEGIRFSEVTRRVARALAINLLPARQKALERASTYVHVGECSTVRCCCLAAGLQPSGRVW